MAPYAPACRVGTAHVQLPSQSGDVLRALFELPVSHVVQCTALMGRLTSQSLDAGDGERHGRFMMATTSWNDLSAYMQHVCTEAGPIALAAAVVVWRTYASYARRHWHRADRAILG